MGYNEYSEFEVEIKNLTQEEMSWFDNMLNTHAELPLDEDDDQDVVDIVCAYIKGADSMEEYCFPQFDYMFAKKDNKLLLCSNETGYSEPEQVANLLFDFIKKFRPKEKFSFRWIRWDNRGKDTYDGGAYFISKYGIESINLKDWCDQCNLYNI